MKVPMKVWTETKPTLLITIPGIEPVKMRKKFVAKVLRTYEQDEKVHRVLKSVSYLNELKNDVTLRLATPRELGAKSDILLSHWLDDMATQNGLTFCSPADAIRVAFYLPKTIGQFREVYAQIHPVWCSTWHVHMRIMEFSMSGDMFVPGSGYPNPVFEIWPDGDKPLVVDWVYSGRRSLPQLDWPVLFRKV